MSSRHSSTVVRRFNHSWHWPSAPKKAGNRDEASLEETAFSPGALQHAIAMISEGIYLLDSETLQVLAVNQPACEMLGRGEQEILGRGFAELCDEDNREAIHREIGNSSRRGAIIITRQKHSLGQALPVELRIRPLEENESSHLLVTVRDLSDQHRADQMARTPAFTDPLTGLADRRAFNQLLQTAIVEAKQGKHHFAVFFIDLNDFHLVNEQFGHNVGDDTLKEIARRLENAFREEDIVARFGGDEFVALVRYSGAENELVHSISARIDASLSMPIEVGSVSLVVSASVGVAQDLQSAKGPREVIERADESMYDQKSNYRRKNGSIRLRAR